MRILILNQAFYPDVVSTAQHATDLACALAAAGHQVTAIASNRAYDNPTLRFPSHASHQGVRIRRIATTGFGKSQPWRRAADFASFLSNCALRLLFQPRYDVVIALTSPPLISFLAALFVRLRGGRLLSWIMDLNPDEALAAGWLRPNSASARGLEAILRFTLRSSSAIVVLDSFMRDRILARAIPLDRIHILPPWTHDAAIAFDPAARAQFRNRHNLDDKFVVMYSGNHSPCHPLDTLLEAARRLSPNPDIAFCFIGGGSEFKKVQAFAANHHLPNILTLPYQPLDQLSASLSSADLHIVVMGDPFVGIVHPCKIYNILALGTPYLYIGPAPSHITELDPEATQARHGDVDAVIQAIQAPKSVTPTHSHSQASLIPEFIRLIEALVPL